MYVGTHFEEITEHVNNIIQFILNWCTCNKLSLNTSKSEFMVVANKRIETRPQLFIGADLVKEVKSFKYIVIYVVPRLNYNAQIKYLKIKLSQLCGLLFKLSKFFKFSCIENHVQLMYMFCNVLLYGSVGWCISVHTSMQCS